MLIFLDLTQSHGSKYSPYVNNSPYLYLQHNISHSSLPSIRILFWLYLGNICSIFRIWSLIITSSTITLICSHYCLSLNYNSSLVIGLSYLNPLYILSAQWLADKMRINSMRHRIEAEKPEERLDSHRSGWKWSDSGYILKESPVRFADERKRGVKNAFNVFGLSHWECGVAVKEVSYYMANNS